MVFRWLCPIEKQSVTNAVSANSLRFAQIYFFAMCLFYISLIFFDALVRNKNGIVALLSIIAAFVQLIGYGTGFLEAIWREGILRKKY